jgi:hypothetical protein
VFLIGGIYFAALAGSGQSSVYAVAPAILCFVSFALAWREDLFFAEPFRIGTGVFVLVLFVAQEYSALSSSSLNSILIASIVVNGVLFFLFLGCLLSVTGHLVRTETEESEEAEEEKSRTASKPVRQSS